MLIHTPETRQDKNMIEEKLWKKGWWVQVGLSWRGIVV